MYDTALLIGRFEPVHSGHLALLREALARARRAIVVVGSAHQARTPKNPFTWQEREAMLRGALPFDDAARLIVLPVRDYYDEARWVQAVQAAVARHVAAGARVALVGHFKDASSGYLRAFPGWELVPVERQGSIDATAIRNAYFGAYLGGAGLNALAGQMPDSTLRFLHAFAQQPAYAALQEEWRTLASYRAAWAQAPYPPVFVTVDAVLRCQDQVLLIRRAHAPGKDLWALPGGFLEPRDTLWQSCLRELAEETSAALTEDQLRAALCEVRVFDHPDRSQRGRTITHAHYFDLGDAPLPAVQGGDDAAAAHWVPVEQLPALEDTLFEDHFHILDHFLHLTQA
ncbi:MAG: bifunctional nicotinamide-nucleotide adenylyltransferase/Nudix hydroxylase [Acidovorax sp.]